MLSLHNRSILHSKSIGYFMKNLFFFIGMAVLLLASCRRPQKSAGLELDCTVNTYDAPISAVIKSRISDEGLYVGLENGQIIKKTGNSNISFSSGKKTRIYDILEKGDDSLFVGTRDGGLKLLIVKNDSYIPVRTFQIEQKSDNYSVYTLAIQHNILYAGTSNGLFKLDLGNLTTPDTLQYVSLPGLGKFSVINKIIGKEDHLYMATNSGLFSIQTSKDIPSLILESCVNHITLDKDTIYALRDDQITKLYKEKDTIVQKKIIDGRYYSFERGKDGNIWILGNHCLLYGEISHDLPNGISSQGKQIAMIDDNFYYVAYREELLAFALHQNTSGIGGSVIAVSDKSDKDEVYFITNDLRLHKYLFDKNAGQKSESLGYIRNLDISDGVVRLTIAGDDGLFFATKKDIYHIKDNTAKCIRSYGKKDHNGINALYYSDEEQRLYIGTRCYVGYLDNRVELSSNAVKPIPVVVNGIVDTTDLYITDIFQDSEKTIYVSTLNKGLFSRKKGEANTEKAWDSEKYGSTFGMTINGKDVLLNTSSGIILNDNVEVLDFLDNKDIKSISSDINGSDFFILNFGGLTTQSLRGSDLDKRTTLPSLFRDITFDKTRICVDGNRALLGCKSGLFLYKNSKLSPIEIEKEKDNTLLYGAIISFIVLVILGSALFYRYNTKQQKDRKKELKKYEANIQLLRKHISDQVKKAYRADLSDTCNQLEDKINRLLKSKRISSNSVESIDKNIKSLDNDIASKVITVNEYIANNMKDITKRIENMRKYPKIGDKQEELNEIIRLYKEIEGNEASQTIKDVDHLKEKLFDLEQTMRKSIESYRYLIDESTSPEIEDELESIREAVRKRYKTSNIKKECDNFVNAHPIMRKLSFMQKKANDKRFYMAVLLLIPDINAKTICEALELEDQQEVNKFKHTIPQQIDRLSEQDPAIKQNEVISLLYNRTKSKKNNGKR